MKERINKLAKGIVDQDIPKILVKPEKIEGTVTVGTVSRGEFQICSENELGIKGIVYSTHSRVQTAVESFHKLRNSIVYEVNTEFLENGDTIEGVFHLITNGGEMEIPYSFHACIPAAGKVLESLETVGNFAAVAKADWQTARNLFIYRNFVEAPFMKESSVRTLYDGLADGIDKDNLLEQFLIALKAKEAVKVIIEAEDKIFMKVTERREDTIQVRKDSWGYTRITAQADGAFIHLLKEELTERDFDGNVGEIPFEILPEKLHGGRNFGCIRVSAGKECITIRIEANLSMERDAGVYRNLMLRRDWLQYFKERLFYEAGGYSDKTAGMKLFRCLDQMEADGTERDVWVPLLRAELFCASGQRERADRMLNECRDAVMKEKDWNWEAYAMYQYLFCKLYGDEDDRDALADDLRYYQEEERDHFFYLYFLEQVEKGLREDTFGLLGAYKKLYANGCISPFLYLRACQMFVKEPSLLRRLDAFEFQVLCFGRRYGMMTKELALAAAAVAGTTHSYHKRQFKFFAALYETYPEPEILAAALGILIKGDCREDWCFDWYEKGVKTGIGLTKLYDYYLYTLPATYQEQLPKEVLLYFSYGSILDTVSKERLYENIVRYWNPDSQIYRLYKRNMEEYALMQMFNGRINRSLAVLYDRMLYKEMIDVRVAEVLPAILKAYRIVCDDPKMKNVIVCSEEMEGNEVYPLEDGEAYVPLYSEKSLILFQDIYGNKFFDVPYHREKIMDHPDFVERCFEVYPDHPMLRLAECRKIVEGVLHPMQIPVLERVMQELPLRTLYRQRILEKILKCYRRSLMQGEKLETDAYLLGLDKNRLTKAERQGICSIMIAQNRSAEAFAMVKTYQMDDISGDDARKLVSRMIMDCMGKKDPFLLIKAFAVFKEGKADNMIVDYLCEYYNGTSGEMYAVLEAAIRDKVETYDMEERLLAQMLFTGDMDSSLDTVFEWYTSRKKQDNSLVKAYFTTKCIEYFLNGRQVSSKVFTYLESMVRRILYKGKIADIYQMALTKYYAEKGDLWGEEVELCAGMIQNLLSQGKVFPYYQKLVQWADIPDDLLDKTMMEYHGTVDSRPLLLLRVLPDEEKFHIETMRHMYKGVYIKEKVLFADETMEYKVAEEEDGVMKIREEGKIFCKEFPTDRVANRITYMNEICHLLAEGDEEQMKAKMEDYGKTTALAKTLFELL